MNIIENEFFEAYKRLDTLCKELYSGSQSEKSGVTQYIEDMKSRDGIGRAQIHNWSIDLRSLKRVRHLRGRLLRI